MGKKADKPRDVKQVIVMRSDLKMRKGKAVAQGGHAAMMWLAERVRDGVCMLSQPEAAWINGSFKKICVKVESEEDLIKYFNAAKEAGLMVRMVTDAGLTEFNGVPTKTCIAIGPDWADKIDPVTGELETY